MKKDIEIREVKDVYIAAVLEKVENEDNWYVYFINDLDIMIEGVMISSKGYMPADKGIEVKSTTFRHKIGNLPAKTAVKVEMISSEVFEIYNEYWVSFFQNNKVMEKKFTFGPYTIDKDFLDKIPVMPQKGILVK